MSRHSHYLFQVVPLFLECQGNLKLTLSRIHFSPGRYESLYRLQKSLLATQELLYHYLFEILRNTDSGHPLLAETSGCKTGDMLRVLQYLKQMASNDNNADDMDGFVSIGPRRRSFPCGLNPQDATIYSNHRQSQGAESQLLFRLIVIFQLLLVRIDDAHSVITGYRIEQENRENAVAHRQSRYLLPSLGLCCLGAVGFLRPRTQFSWRDTSAKQLLQHSVKLGSSLLGFVLLKSFLHVCWMTDKILRSNMDLLEWNHQWELIHCVGPRIQESPPPSNTLTMDEKSKTLIEYAQKHGRKSYFWISTGEIRFLMVKRFMDIYYASVGVGVHCTKDHSFFLPLVAGAAASFYTITGAPTPTVVNDGSSQELIQHAWGMVSLPVLKNLMLQASRLVKGAAVADRIVLCGVPCFILSKDPAPELAAVLQRQAKAENSSPNLSQLSTIAETEIHVEEDWNVPKSFVGHKGQYRQRDVILHLTGGGFFAHTIASDLPYLLDWSSSTGSVVICPEYALLPEHQFPTQLNEIERIYAALASGNTGAELGFDANSIIVTGESAGGNLAAALCVKLAMQSESNTETPALQTAGSEETLDSQTTLDDKIRMPDAIMLSCPALNLTTELSHSRVVGTEDPVLPNALISAISEAYLPNDVASTHCLVSPFYAQDAVLRKFPPTLLFASSKDPLLDDSVTFNERLKVLGVDSELMAVHNVPHAYLGLGTAGFPEAVQVQQYAMDWMSSKFS